MTIDEPARPREKMYRITIFGIWLAQRRRDIHLTHADLAARLNCSVALLRKLESGERRPLPDLIAQLPVALNLDDQQRTILAALLTPVPASGIPSLPTPTFGRDADLTQLARLLIVQHARLVTLVGPPGVGKTRLSIAAAHALSPLTAGAVAFVSLTALHDPALLLETITRSLGLPSRPNITPLQALITHIGAKPFLLLLDNLEQLVEGVAPLAAIIEHCPHVQLLVTSRVMLRLRAERVLRLEPLGLPQDAEHVADSAAVQMFLDRVQALDPSFVPSTSALSDVAAICTRLDGLPLAIEIAATRIHTLSLPTLLTLLSRRLPVLADGPRDLPARQQTLSTAIGWSYDLLSPPAQALFAQLSVFAGGFVRALALPICETTDAAIDHLIDACLVTHDLQIPDRLMLLETLREFGEDVLRSTNQLVEAGRRHALVYADLAERADRGSAGVRPVVDGVVLADEFDNFRAAVAWSHRHDGGIVAARLVAALFRWLRARGEYNEGRRWAEGILAAPEALPDALHARAAYAVGFLMSQQGDPASIPLFDRAITLARTVGDGTTLALTLNARGMVERYPSRFAIARRYFEEALAAQHDFGVVGIEGVILQQLGMAQLEDGTYAEAEATLSRAIMLLRREGNQRSADRMLPELAEARLRQGDISGAQQFYTQAQVAAIASNDYEVIAESEAGLGVCALHLGNLVLAESLLQESFEKYQQMGLLYALMRLLCNLGYVALWSEQLDRAEQLFEQCRAESHPLSQAETIAHALIGLAAVSAKRGEYMRAHTLLSEAVHIQERFQLRSDMLSMRVQNETLEAITALRVVGPA
jgi:predicted ATPase/Tfp pilus assembly protein PilF